MLNVLPSASPVSLRRFVIALVLFVGALGSAHATPIYLGSTDGSPADVDTVFGRLTTIIADYNTANDPDLPTAVFAGHLNKESVPKELEKKNFSLDVTGWDYFVFKAGNLAYYYYVGAVAGSWDFSAPKDLSNYKFFQALDTPPPAVPDGAATAGLLGLALLGIAAVRRELRA